MSYYANMDRIEELWKDVRNAGFKDRKLNDELWRTCGEGQRLYWTEIIPECKGNKWSLPPHVPAYERAIMLLEKEEKWKTALQLVNSAQEVIGLKDNRYDWYDPGINSHYTWYSKRIERLQKKIEEIS